jgi:hypothetical protein
MKLIFNEIVINQVVIDEDLFKEYLENCKDNKISPEKNNFINWMNENIYVGDLIANSNYKYTLSEIQFNDYLNNIKNENYS